jgi:tetratricopeptide (TPR) repeat protein
LLTTRLLDVALQFAGTRAIQVPELNQDESLQLLNQLAPVVEQADAETVQALARATGGLPLALTLLGQHLLVQTGQQSGRRLQTTLARLQRFEERVRLQQPQAGLLRDFRLPTSSAISLQAIIGLSAAGLAQETRQMLSALAGFPAKPNSFPEEAALAIAEGAVEDLDSLVDVGLVEYIGEGRYTLHQTIADYARTQDQNCFAEQRIASYYSDFLASHHGDYALLEPETANIIQALQFAIEHDLQELFIQGALAFVPFLQNRALHQLVEHYLEQAERFARASQRPETLIAVLQVCGNVTLWSGNYEQGEAIYREGLELALQRGDSRQICQFFLCLGRLVGRRGRYGQAERYFQEGLPLARQLADHESVCHLLEGLGVLAGERGAYTQADAFFSESLALARQIASEKLICRSLSNLAVVAAEQAHFALAEQYWQEVLPMIRRLQWNEQLSITLFNLGTLMKDRGNFARAQNYYEECLALNRNLANRERLVEVLVEFSTLLRMQAAYEQAQMYLQEGLELAQQMGHRRLLSMLWLEAGELSLQAAHLAEAEQAFSAVLEHLPDGQHSLDVGAHYGLARVAALRGNTDEARRLGEECLASFAASGYLRLEEVRAWLNSLPPV